MLRFRHLLCIVLMGALIALTSVMAQDKGGDPKETPEAKAAKPAKKAKPAERGYYAIIANALKLTEEQIEKVKAASTARKEAAKKWDEGEKGQKLEALKKQIEALRAERKAFQTAQHKIFEKSLSEILTTEQYVGWKSMRLRSQLMRIYKRVGLTKEQKKQIRSLCDEAAKEIIAGKDANVVKEKVSKYIRSEILTDEQQAKLEKSKAKKAGKKDSKPAESEKKNPT